MSRARRNTRTRVGSRVVKTIIKYCCKTHVVKIFLYTLSPPPHTHTTARGLAAGGKCAQRIMDFRIYGFAEKRTRRASVRPARTRAHDLWILLRRGLECHDTAAHVYGCNTLVT